MSSKTSIESVNNSGGVFNDTVYLVNFKYALALQSMKTFSLCETSNVFIHPLYISEIHFHLSGP